jgi:hypothetical protein
MANDSTESHQMGADDLGEFNLHWTFHRISHSKHQDSEENVFAWEFPPISIHQEILDSGTESDDNTLMVPERESERQVTF